MRQPKVSGRLSAYNATSQNAKRNIAKNNREYKVIIEIGWRVVVTTFALNWMYMQAVVHATQAVIKTCFIATAMNHHITIGQNAIAKATADF